MANTKGNTTQKKLSINKGHRSKSKPTGESPKQVLLRNVPGEVVQLINRKKAEILTNNPYRTHVSHSEAIYKLLLKN